MVETIQRGLLAQDRIFFAAMVGLLGTALAAQTGPSVAVPAAPVRPIAIVPLDSRLPGSAAVVSGALRVSGGRALIGSSGTVTSGSDTTEVTLPQRGMLNVCAATTVKLTADSNVPVGESPGLLMGMDHGAIETNFATGHNADIVLTPDFRILIGGPGTANVKVRLGFGGDTCVDNPGAHAPYVLVTSVFDGSTYRVQPGQRAMFQHGSLKEVVDQEKEPCGCPPSQVKGNEFPLAQSEGLAPLPPPAPAAATSQPSQPLVYNGRRQSTTDQPPPAKKPGFFARVGGHIKHFFHWLFGGE